MKKKLALILSASMLLACAGCKSEETTKKDKKTKKTKDTEISETEEPTETEDSSETPEPTTSESETSEETEATTVQTWTADPVPFTVTHDLESSDLKIGLVTKIYGMNDPTMEDAGGADARKSVVFSFYYLLPYAGSNEAYDAINNIFQDKFDTMYDEYLASLETFVAQETNQEELTEDWILLDTQGFRGDDRVVSFVTYSIRPFTDQPGETCFYNLRGEDGTPIAFDEVVLDKTVLVNYVNDSLSDLGEGLQEMLVADIESGEAEFSIVSNGILVDGFFIPVIGNEAAFDLYFFEATPNDDYAVWSDEHDHIAWDIDDDGILDDITFALGGDANAVGADNALHISWNGKSYVFSSNEIPLLTDALLDAEFDQRIDAKIMYTKNGPYLYVNAQGLLNTYVFTFNFVNGELVFADAIETAFVYSDYAPDEFIFAYEGRFLGCIDIYQDYTIDKDGMFEKISPNYYCDLGGLVTKVEITGTRLDSAGNLVGDMTMEAGTKVTVTGYNEESHLVCLEMETKDGTDGQRMLLDLTTIGDPDDVFEGLIHGD